MRTTKEGLQDKIASWKNQVKAAKFGIKKYPSFFERRNAPEDTPENRKKYAHTFLTNTKEFHENRLERGTAKLLQMGVPQSEIESLRVGGFIAKSGIAEVHAGEEVLEAQEVYRIERALAGATMNQQMIDRVRGMKGMGSAPTIIDASTVQNVSNNTLIRPPSPSGPGLHFERGDFVHKIA